LSLQNAFLALTTKWAGRLGALFDQYRTASLTNPLSTTKIASIKAIFDASASLAFNAPSKYANAMFSVLVDPRVVQPGDYLVGDQGTWFIASTEPIKPILSVACNRTISVSRPGAPMPGMNHYGGATPDTDEVLVTGFPVSILNGTKGERGDANLPGDTRSPWVQILMPSPPGIIFRAFDLVSDDIGRNFIVSAAEETNLGWRLTASLAET
jgi:hypothetical protein